MYNLILLVFLTLILYFWINQSGSRHLRKIKNDYNAIKEEGDKLLVDNARLTQDNDRLKITLEETIAIYDITKQICKSLDESNVFSSFEDEIAKYIRVEEIKFIKGQVPQPLPGDYAVLPLRIDKQHIGNLLAKGIGEHEKEKFQILANQFLLGLRRSLLYQKVQELAIMDSLTGMLSRRYFFERFHEELQRSNKFQYKFSCLMVDLDRFKEYNDRYGHLVGDVLLKEVAKTIKESLRQIDLVGRFGGEEFIIILTETDQEGSLFAAERIRKSVQDKSIRAYDEVLKVTISIGISSYPKHGRDANGLVEKADHALYRAKETGRNRIYVYED